MEYEGSMRRQRLTLKDQARFEASNQARSNSQEHDMNVVCKKGFNNSVGHDFIIIFLYSSLRVFII